MKEEKQGAVEAYLQEHCKELVEQWNQAYDAKMQALSKETRCLKTTALPEVDFPSTDFSNTKKPPYAGWQTSKEQGKVR
jgi:hypothetical protein